MGKIPNGETMTKPYNARATIYGKFNMPPVIVDDVTSITLTYEFEGKRYNKFITLDDIINDKVIPNYQVKEI